MHSSNSYNFMFSDYSFLNKLHNPGNPGFLDFLFFILRYGLAGFLISLLILGENYYIYI